MGRVKPWAAALAAAAVLGVGAVPASAQYFGRNKVQYKTFKFEVLETAHFSVYFYPDERAAARQAAQMAERWYARLSRILNHELSSRQPLILYGSHTDFEQTNVIEGELGEGTGGVTESIKRRIVLPLGGSLAESDHVIGHELVHAFQYDITDVGGGNPMAVSGLARLPLWFIEGMAEYLSIGPVDPNTAMWMRDAASQEKMPDIGDLAHPRYFPYRWGQALWAYLTGRWGDNILGTLLRSAAATGNVGTALQSVIGVTDLDALSNEWHQALREQASTVRQHTRRLTEIARPLQRGTHELNSYNVSPALSPDGRRLMFLGQRDVLSIDLFLADVETGEVLRKVVNTTFDPHFSSLGFINSAGAWSADSRRFALAAVQGGKPCLVILDVNGGSKEREIPFGDLGEIFSPTWSPDGRRIAFSALQGGWTDLFIHDLQTGQTRRLMHDAFADLQPAWSPDGRTLAFVSDRYTTQLDILRAGAYQIVLLDVDTGSLRPVPGALAGKNINPQWGRGGQLYFVSDRTGISNIYRADLESTAPTQVTNIPTGVSGITALSPAISFAPGVNALAFSVYEDNKYNIYAMNASRVADGAAAATAMGLDPARLPPEQRRSDLVETLQQNATIGLPAAGEAEAEAKPYDSKLSLDMVGQPYVAAGVDPLGVFVGGGIALFWSDMLGDHNLATAIQVNGSFGGWRDLARSIGGQVAYQNRKHRWNWGVAGGQVPYLAANYLTGIANQNGTPVGVEQLVIFRQVERSAAGVVAYPFNAAQRLEFSGGISSISFDQRVETRTFDLATGGIIAEEQRDLPAPDTLNLGQFSAALVYDTTTYGATSPVAGQRYRFQLSPTVGTLRFTGVLADYRRYVMPAPFYTLAGRIMHFGRYGPSAEDPRLVPVYLGYPNLVRGYEFNSFSSRECTITATGSCEEFDRLLGSRVLVANLEFRFPLLRPFGVSPQMYGPIPLELAFFGDAGVAWNSGQKPSVFGGGRQGVSSAGVSLRANLFGAIVMQFDVARPFQRRGAGWVFQFNVLPGF